MSRRIPISSHILSVDFEYIDPVAGGTGHALGARRPHIDTKHCFPRQTAKGRRRRQEGDALSTRLGRLQDQP